MADDVYFDGDPETESTRRHLERVLKEPGRHRRWPWVVGSLAAVAAWYFWPRGHGERQDAREENGPAKRSPAREVTGRESQTREA